MYTPSHLLLRSSIFYFRIAVPNRLRPAFSGRTEFCFSLGTRDKKVALTKSWILSLQAERILNQAKALQMTKQDPNRLAFLLKYNSTEGLYVESDPNNLEDGAQALVAIQHLAPVIAAAEQSRPVIDRAEMLREINLANAISGLPPVHSRKLGVLLADYMKVNGSKWAVRTADDYRACIQLFIDTVGDLSVQTVTRRSVADFKVAMSGKMSARTLDKKLVAIKGLIDYAKSTGEYVGENPFSGQLVLKKRDKRKCPSYKEFTSDDLRKLFGENYVEYKSGKPHFFWVPLIGLFTGARINEICQLRVSDLVDYQGIWILSMLAEHDDQSSKTLASQRVVPIHPCLLDLGLVDYAQMVARVTGDKHAMLFPYLVRDKTGYSKSSSRQWGLYLGRLGITDPLKVFHSLRVTANNHLRQAGVDEEKRCQLVGHMHDTVNSQVYSSPLEAKKLAETVLEKLQYPEVDFGLLKPDVKALEVSLRNELERRASTGAHKESRAARLANKAG
jgi:integrase